MTRRSNRRVVLTLLLVAALLSMPGLGMMTRALQQGEVFSPASGHAQVIAQGIADVPGEAVWRAVFHSVAPGEVADLPADGPGFILVDTGGVLIDHPDHAALLAPTEATFQPGVNTILAPVGDRPVGLFAIDLVSPESGDNAGGGIPVFASAPFETSSGARDVDLVRDLLEPGESTTVVGNDAPVLLLVTLGAVRAEATDGSSASLRVGEAATFSGDIVITAEGQAPATIVAAVIGREAPVASGTPGATPAQAAVGSVQALVYACPPAVTPADASPGRCLKDPEAVALQLQAREGETLRDVGPSTERQGLPTWAGLAGGEYELQASGFKDGFGRFYVRGLDAVEGEGNNGFGVGEGGYLIPISADAADYSLEVYVFGPAEGSTLATESTPMAESTPSAETTPEVIVLETSTPAGPTEIPSVIQIETPVPGATTPTPRPRASSTPRPNPITTTTPRATERPIVTSTAVATPRRGSVDLRVWSCLDSIDGFNPANCAQAVDGFDVRLISEDGEVIGLGDAEIGPDGTVSWGRLPLGTYLLQQPVLLPGTVTYYVPNLPLADDGSGYVLTIEADNPVAAVDIYSLPAPAAAPTIAAVAADSDLDGITDADETGVYGTDPLNADSDFDGVLDGAELAAGTDPVVADASAPIEPTGSGDADGDRLLDGDETAFGTDPGNPDSDADGYFDGDEINLGTDPLDGSSFPVG